MIINDIILTNRSRGLYHFYIQFIVFLQLCLGLLYILYILPMLSNTFTCICCTYQLPVHCILKKRIIFPNLKISSIYLYLSIKQTSHILFQVAVKIFSSLWTVPIQLGQHFSKTYGNSY
jgi:hypothetical protein